MVDVHNTKRRLESGIARLKKDKSISKKNKATLQKFIDDCIADGLTPGRINRCLTDLKNINKFLNKNFEKATIKDIKKVVTRIEQSNWKDWTKHGMKITLKKFYKWLDGNEGYPDTVKWIKPRIKTKTIVYPENLLNEDDIMKLVNATKNLRDRAFIMCLYDSGCRIGEILAIKQKHVTFDDYGALLLVDGKTGQRRVRLISGAPYLTEWINKIPVKNPNVSLWISNGNKDLSYSNATKLLRMAAKRADVVKRVNPHAFRHARATYLANHLKEAQMKEHFGWVQGSEMASVYVHLSGRDIDGALLKAHGIAIDNNNNEESKLTPKKCPRCKEINETTNKFCSKCGMIVDEDTRNQVIENELKQRDANKILDKMLEDEEFLEMFKRKVRGVFQEKI